MKKVWLITGCSTGFGRALAQEVLAQGGQVIVTSRKVSDIEDIVESYPEDAIAVALDVTKDYEIFTAVDKAIESFGKIDVLVNNAGIGYFSTIEESDDDEIRKMFEINFFGLDKLTRAVLPHMRKAKSGMILNFSSIGGLMSFPSVGFYNATKFAVEGYSEALNKEVKELGINIVLIEPGPFRTDWAGRSANENTQTIADYSDTAASNVKQNMRGGSGQEPGDPQRAAQAIYEISKVENPPLRLLLGKNAYENAFSKLKEMEDEFTTWKDLTLSADFPE